MPNQKPTTGPKAPAGPASRPHPLRPTKGVLRVLALLVALTIGVAALSAHTMFLKLDSFFLEPHSTGVVALLNGEFDESQSLITRDRMLDVSVVGPGGVAHPPESAWEDASVWNPDSPDTAMLTFETGEPGTYLIGVSTAPRSIALTAEEFNDYLAHDGLLDTIERRKASGMMDDDAVESYSKHVKALVQVGSARSAEWATELGYPVEFIPLENPYELSVGDELRLRLLRDGEPVGNHLVYASHEGYHGHEAAGEHVEAVTTRTNGDGEATIPLSGSGRWYVRTIHMVETANEPDLDFVSHWATLTFEMR